MRKTTARPTAVRIRGRTPSTTRAATTREQVSRLIKQAPIIDTLEETEREALRRDLAAALKHSRSRRSRQRS